MPDPCLSPSPRISLDLVGSPGALSADVVASADDYNGVELHSDGLWTPGRPPIVTGSLPASPADGDEVLFLADAANSVLWHLRYKADEATPNKWIFIGGHPLIARRNSAGTITPAGANDWITLGASDVVGPSIEIPLDGYYAYRWGAQVTSSAAGNLAQVGITTTAFDPNDENVVTNGTGRAVSLAGETPAFGGSGSPGVRDAGDVVILRYRDNGSSGTATYARRWLAVTPLKVG